MRTPRLPMRAAPWLAALLLALALLPVRAGAAELAPAAAADSIRADMLQAQLAIAGDPAAAKASLGRARATYDQTLGPALREVTPEAADRAAAALDSAAAALDSGDEPVFAAARARIWTAVLAGSAGAVESAIAAGDVDEARGWLALREFRHATRFSRPGADATRALDGLAAGTTSADDALAAVRVDLLDTYQARLADALADLSAADQRGFATRRAELAALAEGYFAILAPAYAGQRGEDARAAAVGAFAALSAAAVNGAPVDGSLAHVDGVLAGFRAAPLSPGEQARRAGQLLRFLALVPVEYGRGVRGGQVTKDLEIREAITFRDGAAAAFADLRDGLAARDGASADEIAALLASLELRLADAGAGGPVADPREISGDTERALALLRDTMPADWQRQDSAADFDVIATALDRMEAAVAAGDYAAAEQARLEAYAFLETGPEARLIAFAPERIAPLEDLFWYGQGQQQGLAFLLAERAPRQGIAASRAALDASLAEAQRALSGGSAPAAVGANAAIIVFREGLEAVLILASLMGSLKIGEQRRLRGPIWWGAGAALLASALTWLLASGALTALAQYGERLEAVVSLIAIAVLLVITNWFFHDVYWTGWMANFHTQKRRIIGSAGQWLGLVVLGFSSIYREGFETVLFLQALVLEAGSGVVLGGVAVGLAFTLLVGLVVFAVQAKLPYKKMLIYTGVMIGAVLLVMVGNTAHVLQVVGWLPTHPIRWLTLPYWSGMWFGVYPTWEGIGLQAAAAAFVIGSYYLSEWLHRRARHTGAAARTAARSA